MNFEDYLDSLTTQELKALSQLSGLEQEEKFQDWLSNQIVAAEYALEA